MAWLLPGLILVAILAPAGVVYVSHGSLAPAYEKGIALLVALLWSAGLVALARMLREIERGHVFTPVATRHFRRFALLLLLAALSEALLPPLAELVQAIAFGRHSLSFKLQDTNLLLLLLGVLLFLIARLFDEAARIEEENRSII